MHRSAAGVPLYSQHSREKSHFVNIHFGPDDFNRSEMEVKRDPGVKERDSYWQKFSNKPSLRRLEEEIQQGVSLMRGK